MQCIFNALTVLNAAGCIIEYVGKLACMAGFQQERKRAKEYLQWLLEQRSGEVHVDAGGRDVRFVLLRISALVTCSSLTASNLAGLHHDENSFRFRRIYHRA